MADADSTDSGRGTAGRAAGRHATEAFSLLGDETRISILLALWEHYDPHATDNALRFSELFERVDYESPGNFSYHLEQLKGRFVRQDAENGGYGLRALGLELVKALVAGTGIRDETVETTEIDQPCPFCGAPTAIGYREGLVLHTCTECEGPTPGETDVDGFLSAVPFEPAGLADRTAEEIRAASRVASLRQIQSMFDEVCPTCSGAVDGWLECCPDHDPVGVCERCGTEFPAWARFRCRVCKDHANTSPKSLALLHPAAVAFYEDHGVSMRLRASDVESVRRGFELMDAHRMELVSEDPPRVDVVIERGGDELRLAFDETATVVDVRR